MSLTKKVVKLSRPAILVVIFIAMRVLLFIKTATNTKK